MAEVAFACASHLVSDILFLCIQDPRMIWVVEVEKCIFVAQQQKNLLHLGNIQLQHNLNSENFQHLEYI
jgi:hypothetical protein